MKRKIRKEIIEKELAIANENITLEDKVWSLRSISYCCKEDLQRHREGKLLKGKIKVGQIFEWEPDKFHSAETCIVTKIIGDQIFTIGNRFGKNEVYNDISRFKEAAVRSMIKCVPSYKLRQDNGE